MCSCESAPTSRCVETPEPSLGRVRERKFDTAGRRAGYLNSVADRLRGYAGRDSSRLIARQQLSR
jgi:hypothetical protein